MLKGNCENMCYFADIFRKILFILLLEHIILNAHIVLSIGIYSLLVFNVEEIILKLFCQINKINQNPTQN